MAGSLTAALFSAVNKLRTDHLVNDRALRLLRLIIRVQREAESPSDDSRGNTSNADINGAD